MKDFLYFYWNFHSRGGAKAAMAMLRRCDLRHEARQSTDIEIDDPDADPDDEPWTTGSDGCVKLPADDPRIPLLIAELRKVGIEPHPMHYRTWSPKVLDAVPWLVYTGYTTMVTAGNINGQQWDFTSACPTCGTGAAPIPPLIARVDRMPKQGFTGSCPDYLIIITKSIATALAEARLTGFELEPLRTPSRDKPDDRFRWLRITSKWPAPSPRPTCRIRPTCPICRGPALHHKTDEPSEIHYDTVPAAACDFNEWQGTIAPPAQPAAVLNRPTGGSRLLIFSQRARQILKRAGVRTLKCEPIFIGGATPAPAPPAENPAKRRSK